MTISKKHIRIPLLIFMLVIFALQKTFGSDVKVSNISIPKINKEKRYAYVQFDIEWKNSWRCDIPGNDGYEEPANRDAAWIFIKYLDNNEWHHVTLSHISKQHIIPSDLYIESAVDGKGVFLSRKENGKGDLHCTNVRLKWNYAPDNINISNSTQLKVLAIEMVHIPKGSFFAGDDFSYGAFYDKQTKKPALISDKPVVLKSRKNYFDDSEITGHGIVVNGTEGIRTLNNSLSNTEFPAGFKAFYIMKYEISQQQYTDFLNTLSKKQKKNRYMNEYNKYNNFIRENKNVFECKHGNIACNFLSWMDGAAFADWAGLRPMTELEYEKACRGFNTFTGSPNTPIKGEYAWNSVVINKAHIKNINDSKLIQVTGNASFDYSLVDNERFLGPLQNGIYEHKKIKTKSELGASYYDVMELSGNLTELCVTIGNAAGRSFTGLNGDGYLNKSGDADVTNWPGINGNNDDSYPNFEYLGNAIDSPGVTGDAGAGQRGGSWSQEKELLTISNRTFASRKPKGRDNLYGFRCVRSVNEN